MQLSKIIIFFLCVSLLWACQERPLLEDQQILEEGYWVHQDTVIFTFAVEEPLQKHLAHTLRYHRDYRYCNLFIQYALLNARNDTLAKQRLDESLFDCQTGRPLGRGIEDWYDQELYLLKNFSFPEAGTYRLLLQHHMRLDTLPHIRSVGFNLRNASSK
ncbi:MAG: gliding motility lipoprotein GldH [Bernardetiaceae bacterium]